MDPPCTTPDLEYPVICMEKLSGPDPGSPLSWTVIWKLVVVPLAVPVPLMDTLVLLNMAEVIRAVLKSRPVEWSW